MFHLHVVHFRKPRRCMCVEDQKIRRDLRLRLQPSISGHAKHRPCRDHFAARKIERLRPEFEASRHLIRRYIMLPCLKPGTGLENGYKLVFLGPEAGYREVEFVNELRFGELKSHEG